MTLVYRLSWRQLRSWYKLAYSTLQIGLARFGLHRYFPVSKFVNVPSHGEASAETAKPRPNSLSLECYQLGWLAGRIPNCFLT